MRVIEKLCQTSHQNIVSVFGYGRLNPESGFYYIDMELCAINLEQYIEGKQCGLLPNWKLPVEVKDALNVVLILEHVMSGLGFIHNLKEVHRDLNPPNGTPLGVRRLIQCSVLYSSKDKLWKIADFGLTSPATSLGFVSTTRGRGKPAYTAPELLQDPSLYNKKTDIWSLGCILFELCTGEKLFNTHWEVWNYAVGRNSRTISFSSLREPSRGEFAAIVQATIDCDVDKRPTLESLTKSFAKLRNQLEQPKKAKIAPVPEGTAMSLRRASSDNSSLLGEGYWYYPSRFCHGR